MDENERFWGEIRAKREFIWLFRTSPQVLTESQTEQRQTVTWRRLKRKMLPRQTASPQPASSRKTAKRRPTVTLMKMAKKIKSVICPNWKERLGSLISRVGLVSRVLCLFWCCHVVVAHGVVVHGIRPCIKERERETLLHFIFFLVRYGADRAWVKHILICKLDPLMGCLRTKSVRPTPFLTFWFLLGREKVA